MRLHDILHGSDLHRVFHHWWSYAAANYVQIQDSQPLDTVTLYYDPIVDYHHRIGLAGGLGMVWQITPQKRDVARLLFEAAADQAGWTTLEPVREMTRDRNSGVDTPQATLLGLILAREFGNEAVYSKLKAHAEAHYEPAWDTESGEFTWRFGLEEPHPRGQFNGAMMTAEAGSEGAWWRVYNEPNLRKFVDPTVYGVDFPTVCLSQASYDAERRLLVISTDAGLPGSSGQPTSFRVRQIDPKQCQVTIDGQRSEDWHVVDGEVEITTTVGPHTFLITH